MPVRLVIFDDNNALRNSLKAILEGVEGYAVVGDFGDCARARQVAEELQPDIVIMDIDMPLVDGIEGLRTIKEARPSTAIIMHTVFEDDEKLFESLCAGANGYLLKNASYNKLLDALEEVRSGGAPMSPAIARKVLLSFSRPQRRNTYNLSERELDVLQHLVKGYSYKMIAATLFVSLATVQSHIRNIYAKLHVNCGREAVVVALRDKIV